MTKKTSEPDELRMPAEKFDEMMRKALGAKPPDNAPKKPKTKSDRRGAKAKTS